MWYIGQKLVAKHITILTPYLGQLAHIRQALISKKMTARLNDRDQGDLAQMDLLGGGGVSATSAARNASLVVHAATVDNYQGIVSDKNL